MRIKTILRCAGVAAVIAWALHAQAALVSYEWNSGFNNGGIIPDDNGSGWSDTRTVSTSLSAIESVNVLLNLSGGFNGDLYGYLTHDSGIAILLNRVGKTADDAFGYADAGFVVTLSDLAGVTTDIHSYGGNAGDPLTGVYQSDGRDVDPEVVLDTDARDARLTGFTGLEAGGTWTLYFADLSGGGDLTTVAGWGLEISAVPEPANWALAIFGAMLAIANGVRRLRLRFKIAPLPPHTASPCCEDGKVPLLLPLDVERAVVFHNERQPDVA